jgi:hypothetical protein
MVEMENLFYESMSAEIKGIFASPQNLSQLKTTQPDVYHSLSSLSSILELPFD